MSSPVTHRPLRATLMESTSQAHRAAEDLVDALSIFASETAYVSWLSANLRLHQHYLGTVVAAAELVGLEPIGPRLVAALQQDLRDLTGQSPRPEPQPTNHSELREDQLGVLYVFEGSGLGARVLHERATAASMPSVEFLQRSSDLTKGRWPKVVSALNGYSDDGTISLERCIAAANGVFHYFITALGSSSLSQPKAG